MLILAHNFQLGGWPAYVLTNASGQYRYPKGTNRNLVFSLLNDIYSRLSRSQFRLAHVLASSPDSSDDLDRWRSLVAHWNLYMDILQGLLGSLQTLSCSLSMVGETCCQVIFLVDAWRTG